MYAIPAAVAVGVDTRAPRVAHSGGCGGGGGASFTDREASGGGAVPLTHGCNGVGVVGRDGAAAGLARAKNDACGTGVRRQAIAGPAAAAGGAASATFAAAESLRR